MKHLKRMCTLILLSAILLTFTFQQGAQASAKAPHIQATEEVAKQISELLIDVYGSTGVQYAIRHKGSIVLSDGIGFDQDGNKVNLSNDTMFGIGSVSKMYVTAATMLLVDEGKVDIDDPLTTYIPDFKMADERYKSITPRMLMNHAAGLYGTHYKNSMLFDDNDTQNFDDLLEHLSIQRLKSEPGEYSVYANDGFQLLELLVEHVSGMTYSAFLEKSFSQPLGLLATKTPQDRFDRNRLYSVTLPPFEQKLPVENANVIGTGGIYSTAEELTAFSEVLIGEQPSLLSNDSALAMQKPEYKNGIWVSDQANTFNYGLGWDAVELYPFDEYGIKAITKGGDTILYSSALIALPEYHISIALLTAGGVSILNTLAATEILLAYLQEVGVVKQLTHGKIFNAPIKQKMPEQLEAYSAIYGTVGSTLNIKVANGEVSLPDLMGGFIPAQTYVYTGNNEFVSADGQTTISFEEQENGHTYLRVKCYLVFPGIGQTLLAYYEYQRLEANTLSSSVEAIWEKRNGKAYYALDEKINSLFYLSTLYLTKVIEFDKEKGYASGTKILDHNHAINVAEIPVMNGRDVFDLSFEVKAGAEYLKADGRTYIDEDAIASIYEGNASIATIPSTGHVRWFKIGKGAAGKTMQVDLQPYNNDTGAGGFLVYDAQGNLLQSSIITGKTEVTLPESGLIVFGGEAGSKFYINLH